MGEIMARFGLKPANKESAIERFGLRRKGAGAGPGDSMEVIQEQGVTPFERRAVMQYSPNVPSAIEWLSRAPGADGKPPPEGSGVMAQVFSKNATAEDRAKKAQVRQYEAREYKPGHIAVRPKGDRGPWRPVDPDTGFFSTDFLRDVSDIAPEMLTALMPAKRAITVGATVAGGELARRGRGVGEYGFKDNVEDALKDAALQGVTGGAVFKVAQPVMEVLARPIGAVANKVGAALRRPAMRQELGKEAMTLSAAEGAAVAERKAAVEPAMKELGELSGSRQRLKADIDEVQAATQPPIAAESRAKANVQREALAAEDEIIARRGQTEAAIASGKQEAASLAGKEIAAEVPQAARGLPSPSEAAQAGIVTPVGRRGLSIVSHVLDPAYGVRAANLARLPGFLEIGQKWFGDRFRAAVGSQAMETADRYLAKLAEELPAKELERVSQGYASDIASWMLGSPEFKALSQEARTALAKMSQGAADAQAEKVLKDALLGVIKNGQVPEGLRLARRGLREARVPASEARAVRQEEAIGFKGERARISAAEVEPKATKRAAEDLYREKEVGFSQKRADIAKRMAELGPGSGGLVRFGPIGNLEYIPGGREAIIQLMNLAGKGVQGLAKLPPALRDAVTRSPQLMKILEGVAPVAKRAVSLTVAKRASPYFQKRKRG